MTNFGDLRTDVAASVDGRSTLDPAPTLITATGPESSEVSSAAPVTSDSGASETTPNDSCAPSGTYSRQATRAQLREAAAFYLMSQPSLRGLSRRLRRTLQKRLAQIAYQDPTADVTIDLG